MTQYNTSQLDKLKSGIKNGTEIELVIVMMRLVFLINDY